MKFRREVTEIHPLLLLWPAVIVLVLLTLIPFVYSINLSVHDLDYSKPYLGNPFIGLGNYIEIFQDKRALHSYKTTYLIVGGAIAIELLLGLAIALLLTLMGRCKNILLLFIIFPMLISRIIVALIWRSLFSPIISPINWFLTELLGVSSLPWLSSVSLTFFVVVMADVWQWTPFLILIFSAGLEMLPRDLYEVASLDGASARHTFLHITLPLLLPVMGVGVLFRILDAMRTFDIIYALTGGGPGTTTETLDIYAYFIGLSRGSRLSYAAALSIVLLGVTIAVFTVLMRRFKGMRAEW